MFFPFRGTHAAEGLSLKIETCVCGDGVGSLKIEDSNCGYKRPCKHGDGVGWGSKLYKGEAGHFGGSLKSGTRKKATKRKGILFQFMF